ncbi:MAG: GTP cyclohydrolase I FolE2 [Betaproteobacteria bacterium]|nr:GTP cyclohydrolase I FolE2 [Betaproteobacteria bacterium]
MNAPERISLPDIQSRPDTRSIVIDRVGIKDLLHPIRVRTAGGESVATVATAEMYVRLPAHATGTHMSRFVELLEAHEHPVDLPGLRELTGRMLQRLDAESGFLGLSFPYFIRKLAPVSGVASRVDYRVVMSCDMRADRGVVQTLEVTAPVTSLCPCSREISDYGAHNQRSHITIAATLCGDLTIEDLVAVAEQEASCEVFGLLKRPDEKWVTERAYDNPKFVEDLVRDIALRLDADDRIARYVVESENFESIHNHSAYARIERDRRVPAA